MSLFSADTEIDLVTRRDPRQIRGRRFARVRKGYDPDQVRDFLDEVATWMERLESELLAAQEEAESISRRAAPDPYAQMGTQLAELMRAAEEHAARIRGEADDEAGRQIAAAEQRAEEIRVEAQVEAKRLRAEAQDDAERMRREAQDEATEIRAEAHAVLESARAEADATLAGLAAERELLLTELKDAKERLAGALSRLDDVLEDPQSATVEASGPPVGAGTDLSGAGLDDAEEEEEEEEEDELDDELHDERMVEAEPAAAPEGQQVRAEDAGSVLGLDPEEGSPDDAFEWPELPPDPWEFTAELDRQLFGQLDRDASSGDRPPSASLFEDEDAGLDPPDIDIQIPDIPLIDDRNHRDGPGEN